MVKKVDDRGRDVAFGFRDHVVVELLRKTLHNLCYCRGGVRGS